MTTSTPSDGSVRLVQNGDWKSLISAAIMLAKIKSEKSGNKCVFTNTNEIESFFLRRISNTNPTDDCDLKQKALKALVRL